MAVQIGKDKTICIQSAVLDEIYLSIKQYRYETGGIIGIDERGVVSAFQFDKSSDSNPFEYSPNVDFLNHVINERWAKQNIRFVGFVHSHLHNCELSMQDIDYCRYIIGINAMISSMLIGIIDLSKECNKKWYVVSKNGVIEVCDKNIN